ncbi:MAG: hypothetical protein PVI57_09100 [Gemmatimonadota bacterium]|jgi:hypothetical protein
MTDPSGQTFVYTVADARTGGHEHYVSPVPPELASRHGLPPEAILGKLTDGPDSFDVRHFRPNPRFVPFLHWVLARHAAECPGLRAAVEDRRDGQLGIVDRRTTATDGAVPPQDVIGTVEVRAGEMIRYRGNPDYRSFTRDGVMSLDPWFRSRLLEEIEALGGAAGHDPTPGADDGP